MHTLANDFNMILLFWYPVTVFLSYRELGPRVFSGGKDGFLHLWDSQFNRLWSLSSLFDLDITT